jgi:hypothetical protein
VAALHCPATAPQDMWGKKRTNWPESPAVNPGTKNRLKIPRGSTETPLCLNPSQQFTTPQYCTILVAPDRARPSPWPSCSAPNCFSEGFIGRPPCRTVLHPVLHCTALHCPPSVESTSRWPLHSRNNPANVGETAARLELSAVQCSAVQCSAVQCSAVQCSAWARFTTKQTECRVEKEPQVDLTTRGSPWVTAGQLIVSSEARGQGPRGLGAGARGLPSPPM